jgi:hypothetical protein
MNTSEEILRKQIAEASRLFVKPHDDRDWGFHGIWDGNFLKKYSMNRFIGHKGIIPIKGTELLLKFPSEEIESGQLIVYDSFTDANGTVITSHTTDSNHTYSDHGTPVAEIQSNELQTTSTADQILFIDTSESDCIVRLKFNNKSADVSWSVRLYLRHTGISDHIQIQASHGTPSQLVLNETDGGVGTTHDSVNVTIDNNTYYILYAKMIGNLITGELRDNDENILASVSGEITFNQTETEHGFYLAQSTAIFIDDFKIIKN